MRINPADSVIEGTDVVFECTAKSNPPPLSLRLYGLDGTELKMSKGKSDDTLMLRFTKSDIDRKEIGNYTCTAKNQIASGYASIWLNILCLYLLSLM